MNPAEASPLAGLQTALANLLNAELRFGAEVVEAVTGVSLPRIASTVGKMGRRATRGCCEIPPPCWMPRPLGECVSYVCQCKSVCIDLVVTNCDRAPHTVSVHATGAADKITVAPTSLSLGPMERGTFHACLAVPAEAADGEKLESVLWVRGCREHFLRWTVNVGTVGLSTCDLVEVDDCPDLIHHWYDHFYCPRPCTHDQKGANQ